MIFETYYVSVSSKPDHPLGQPSGNFERENSPPLGHKESVKPRPLRQKNRANTPPPGQLYSKIQPEKNKET